MKKNILKCPIDVRCKLFEEGICKEKEEPVLLVGNLVLLERETENGERFVYRVVNVNDYSSKYLFSRKYSLKQEQYISVVDRIMQLRIGEFDTNHISDRIRSENLLMYLFEEILPQHGMRVRNNQKELALIMLRALQDDKLALCEAEVGTGKTHAYILAIVVYNLFAEVKAPAVISTSTIALQKAITEEYIPQISRILLEHHVIKKPLSFIVRKGKNHYVCDMKLKTYESSIRYLQRREDEELIVMLESLWERGVNNLDLDNASLTPYVKARINVYSCNDSCSYAPFCRYMNLKKRSMSGNYDFQITNHNYVLANIIGQKQGNKSLFPEYKAVVLDEAHRFTDAARQMYSTKWEEQEVESVIIQMEKSKETYMLPQLSQIRKCNKRLFTRLSENLFDCIAWDENMQNFQIDSTCKSYIRYIQTGLEQLPDCVNNADLRHFFHKKCSRLLDKIHVFHCKKGYIYWNEKKDNGRASLCALPAQLERLLYQDFWSRRVPVLITSGTMSVHENFEHFQRQTGLKYASAMRIIEVSKKSPFAYQKNGLIYIPENMPFPDTHDNRYIEGIVPEITRIINASHGHALILCTSYWMMDRIYYYLKNSISGFPLFMMGKGRLDSLRKFRESGNGILIASDSAGEGIDLAGDILSCLIIVKLPFPVPDPIMEFQRRQYDSFELYRNEIIIPEMLIKLRQWFGRGIRREDDTTVFSILDSRVSLHGRYREEVLNTLPFMPVTDRIEDVAEFIKRNKNEAYFGWENKEI